ncbi:unnamed protein product [Didymodactylos carnosus]|uniref:HAT C-terminal dimerisation domain-containing protein n=1 Tax=Didymodactylos carnosus TaxID=1234261 RepID=A0A8S2N1Y6_9BILA|nr:unnamed protein product [Didymodactylos carnosus]CAF3976325.1 unnamed protein product [Didymodactylos carnosus]
MMFEYNEHIVHLLLNHITNYKKKGLDGITNHEVSQMHLQSISTTSAELTKNDNNTIIGKINAINMNNCTLNYLRALARTFLFMLTQEFALNNFEDLIKLQARNLAEPITKWLSVSNNKQRYWSGESRAEWLLSVKSYLWKKQLNELKNTNFLTVMLDETTGINNLKQLVICLRFFNTATSSIVEQIFRLTPIESQTGENLYNKLCEFLTNIQNELEKEFIIVCQCYDGASALRFQLQGHFRARWCAFAIYLYCRSHLLNLCVKDAIGSVFNKTYKLVRSTLIFIRDGAFRAILLKRSQEIQATITNSNNESDNDDNLNDTSSQNNNKNNRVQYVQQKPRPKKATLAIPTPSDTRWIYHYQLISFMWKHLAAVVATLSQIVEKDDDGSPTANGYALQLIDKTTIFEINVMENALRHSYFFLKEIEHRSSTLDKFCICLDSTKEAIANTMNVFDFELYKEKLATIDNIVPTVLLTSQCTRRGGQHRTTNDQNNDINIDKLIKHGYLFLDKFMESIEDRFNQNCRMVVDNITYFSNPQEYDDNKLIDNELLLFYCNSIHFKHKDTNKSMYEKTENAILNKHLLQKQLPRFRSTIRTITGLLEITKCLSKCGVYRLSEWYKFYQILITIPLGANECEKSFSALTRIKTKLRNRLGNDALETTVKYAIMKPYMNNDDIDYIVSNFYANPTRAESRNVKIFVDDS